MTFLKKMGTLAGMTTRPQEDVAIKAALTNDWALAIKSNLEIIKASEADVPALLRLAFAYFRSGEIKLAKSTYHKIKKFDPYNQIAAKQLEKLEMFTKDSLEVRKNNSGQTADPASFLEDPGITKITQCVHVAPKKTIATLVCGQEVYLKTKNHGIEVRDQENHYLGALPDDLAFKMLKLIAAKNEYQVFVRSIEKNCITLLIREISRGKKFKNQPSFTTLTGIDTGLRLKIEQVSREDKPEVVPTGEDES